jgi:hypothetical protein
MLSIGIPIYREANASNRCGQVIYHNAVFLCHVTNLNKSQTTGYIVHSQNVSLQSSQLRNAIYVFFGPTLADLFPPIANVASHCRDPKFSPKGVHMAFVVGKVTVALVFFSKNFAFPCQCSTFISGWYYWPI